MTASYPVNNVTPAPDGYLRNGPSPNSQTRFHYVVTPSDTDRLIPPARRLWLDATATALAIKLTGHDNAEAYGNVPAGWFEPGEGIAQVLVTGTTYVGTLIGQF